MPFVTGYHDLLGGETGHVYSRPLPHQCDPERPKVAIPPIRLKPPARVLPPHRILHILAQHPFFLHHWFAHRHVHPFLSRCGVLGHVRVAVLFLQGSFGGGVGRLGGVAGLWSVCDCCLFDCRVESFPGREGGLGSVLSERALQVRVFWVFLRRGWTVLVVC